MAVELIATHKAEHFWWGCDDFIKQAKRKTKTRQIGGLGWAREAT